MSEVTILAIDPGSKLGYCVGKSNKKTGEFRITEYGQEETETQSSVTHRQYHTEVFIESLYIRVCPDVAVVEEVRPMGQQSWKGSSWMQVTHYLAAKAALIRKIPYFYPLPRTWKSQMFPDIHQKGCVPKNTVVDIINEKYGLTLKYKDDDTAEAICMAEYGHHVLTGKFEAPTRIEDKKPKPAPQKKGKK
jgi:Holliday junction resolvasome RuvABC endonuclease subunit